MTYAIRLMTRAVLLVASTCVAGLGVAAPPDPPRSATPVTLDGIIHQDSDDTLAFTPDRDAVFFDRSEGPRKTIMVSRRIAGHWSAPKPASFSGHWFDQDPLVAPDGSFLLFNSDRPLKPGGPSLVQSYFAGGPGPGSNLWRVERRGDRWGDPVWLGPTINSDVFIDFASLAADGTLYYMRWDATTKIMQLLRSRYEHGAYLTPQRVALGDPAQSIHDPAVAPDQSFIVFDYGRVKGGLGRLCIAFREGDHWSLPADLGDELNRELPWGSHLDPDGRTVYFTGNSGIRRLSLTPWLEAHRTEGAHRG